METTYSIKRFPKQTPAILWRYGDEENAEIQASWDKVLAFTTLQSKELLPKTHPATFHYFRHEKGVEEEIKTKDPRIPVTMSYLYDKKTKMLWIRYDWSIRDERGVHNEELSALNEYSLRSPNGRLGFCDSILAPHEIKAVYLALATNGYATSTKSTTYVGTLPTRRKNRSKTFVSSTFKRFPLRDNEYESPYKTLSSITLLVEAFEMPEEETERLEQ